jgi:hypothetical protein
MGYRRYVIGLASVGALIAGMQTSSASALTIGPVSTPPILTLTTEDLTLDSGVGGVGTSLPMLPLVTYKVTVSGTYSPFLPSLWNKPPGNFHVTCGTTEPAPTFPSAGLNGPVGDDAETLFATVAHKGCGSFHPPIHHDHFEIDTGSGFHHVVPVGGPYSTPQPGHTYTYLITSGELLAPAKFRIADHNYLDNYGQLKIKVQLPI